MSNRRIFCFGDSFTVGEGANLKLQREIEDLFKEDKNGGAKSAELVSEINKKLSWTQHLADRFKVHVENRGESGSNNERIFNSVFKYDFELGGITKDDLVIIMWSSSVRNPLSWIPYIFAKTSPIGAGWSLKEMMDEKGLKNFVDVYSNPHVSKHELEYVQKHLVPFMGEYFKTFITDLYDESYYNTVNLNLIKFLQDYFKSKGIKYIMIDAFERMDSFKAKDDKRWDELIDTSTYIGFGETTLWDMLEEEGGDIWEDPELSYSPAGQRQHPNAEGYKIAGKIIGDFIEKNIWKRTAI